MASKNNVKRSLMDEDITAIMIDFGRITEKYTKCREYRTDLENVIKMLRSDLNEARRNEMANRKTSESSRKLIAEQQAIIGKLVAAKEEIKACNEQLNAKSSFIEQIQDEKHKLVQSFQSEKQKLFDDYQESIKYFKSEMEAEVNVLNREIEKQKYMYTEQINALNNRITTLQSEKQDQINFITLDYEEQLQRAHAQLLQMRDEMRSLAGKNNNNITMYKKKISDLESIIKQNDCKNLAQVNGECVPQISEIQCDKNITSAPGKNSFGILRPHLKSNQGSFDPLPIQISGNLSQSNKNEPPKGVVKPSRRKLFNKFQEDFYE